jgi:hypothetical protein
MTVLGKNFISSQAARGNRTVQEFKRNLNPKTSRLNYQFAMQRIFVRSIFR